MKTFIVSFLLLCSVVLAEPYKGIVAHGVAAKDFPCDRFLQIASAARKPVTAILFKSFGLETECLQKYTERFKNRKNLLILYFSYEASRRRRDMESYEFYAGKTLAQYDKILKNMRPKTKEKIHRRVRGVLRWLSKVNLYQTRVVLTTGLEDYFSNEAYRKLYKEIKAGGWPYEIARNPSGGGTSIRGSPWRELHNHGTGYQEGQNCIWSNDGHDIDYGDGRTGTHRTVSVSEVRELGAKFAKRCDAVIYWKAANSGYSQFNYSPPRDRRFSITDKDISILSNLLKN